MANTYTTYKDSGIPWIGEIPEHWQVCRIKNVATCNDDTLSETTSPYLPIEYVEIGDVNSSEGIVHTEFYSFKDAPSRARRITQKGDVIVSTVRTYLRAISKIDKNGLIVSTGFAVLRAVKYHADYLAYSALSESFINNVIAISTGISYPAVNATQISNLPILLPSQIEQESIANFLDGKCSEIDELISLQEKMIDELKAYKQSVITEAVTKGLDRNVKMKDSGINWIGEIPEHWDEVKTLFMLEQPITDGPHETPIAVDEGIPFISAEAVSSGEIDFSHKWGNISKEYYEECSKKYVPLLDDIYMIKSGASTGRTAIVKTKELFTIWSPLAVFRANKKKMRPKFLLYVLRSEPYQKQVETKWSFGTQQNIGMRSLEKIKISYPKELSEQQAIADFLDTKCSEIDTLISIKEKKIEELKDYKKSLIYEYVTGKKRV